MQVPTSSYVLKCFDRVSGTQCSAIAAAQVADDIERPDYAMTGYPAEEVDSPQQRSGGGGQQLAGSVVCPLRACLCACLHFTA